MYAFKQVRARENVRAHTEKHALSLGFRRALLFQISWELGGPKQMKSPTFALCSPFVFGAFQ